ncbi:tRNA (adenosine(37)-N6)-threonylcarbamoyltransferase complex ATPase subunit type 1 TsaE [Helicobacter pametensis]|uniref:tRNA (adenosine(37)-N6)-threonylcarbamoyltransferase complex ATPase subunit type 1 TsaE n=1 Tax=Helicobacter pametensis TaxID=95149 RepID=UPI0004B127B6|nr:tRNA (adenosine(37)-N6)-threonylcarbamoyltransferase complex ATPase subunit type 1 TsaE [Helicobacter pametensis]
MAIFHSLQNTLEALIPMLSPHHIILLRGDLASGKTTLVQELSKQIGLSAPVTSPTFGIQNIYPSSTHTLFHYDLYRKSLMECLELGLLEMLDTLGWHFVEWGDEHLENLLKQSGFAMIVITISKTGATRSYRISQ